MNTWEEYTEACVRTAIYPPEHRITYPALGLISEVGEVAGKLKKHLRDGGELPREALLDELGDVTWYCATLARECGWDLQSEVGDALASKDVSMVGSLEENVALIARHASAVEGLFRGTASQRSVCESVGYVVWFVADIAVALGSTLPAVLERNIAKLASRKERGVIGGSGDTR